MTPSAEVLPEEASRRSIGTIEPGFAPPRPGRAQHSPHLTALKRAVRSLEREIAAVRKRPSPLVAMPPTPSTIPPSRRFQPRSLRALRARLVLSASDLGSLVGVSGQMIHKWEAGKALPRCSQIGTIAELHQLGRREVAERLAAQRP